METKTEEENKKQLGQSANRLNVVKNQLTKSKEDKQPFETIYHSLDGTTSLERAVDFKHPLVKEYLQDGITEVYKGSKPFSKPMEEEMLLYDDHGNIDPVLIKKTLECYHDQPKKILGAIGGIHFIRDTNPNSKHYTNITGIITLKMLKIKGKSQVSPTMYMRDDCTNKGSGREHGYVVLQNYFNSNFATQNPKTKIVIATSINNTAIQKLMDGIDDRFGGVFRRIKISRINEKTKKTDYLFLYWSTYEKYLETQKNRGKTMLEHPATTIRKMMEEETGSPKL